LAITGTAGNFTLTFTPTSLAAVTSASFALGAGAAAKLGLTTAAATAASGAAFGTQPVVAIQDSSGNTVTGNTSTVTVAITGGAGGTLVGTTSVAAVNGVATFSGLGISGTAGTTYTLTYSDGALTVVSQSIVPTVGAATAVAISTQPSGAVNGVAFTTQPVVRIIDSGGNTVTSSTAAVTVTIATGTGTLSGTVTVNAVSGVATFTNLAITGTAGNFTLTFTPAALAAVTSASFALGAGAAAKLGLTTAAATAASGAAFGTQPVVTIQDSGSNTVTGNTSTVTVAITGGAGGTLVGTTSVAAVNGVATFSGLGISGTAGVTYTLTYSDGALTVVTQTITPAVGAAVKLGLTTSAAGSASGVAFSTQPVVKIQDSGGNTVTGNTSSVTVAITGGVGGTLVGTTSVAASAGVATFSGLGLTGTSGVTYTLTYSDGTLTVATQTIVPGAGAAAAAAVATQPGGAVNGFALTTQPVVNIVDGAGNIVTSSTAAVVASIASGTGTLYGTTTVNALNGVATFTNLMITGNPGSFTLTFTPAGLTAVNSTAFSLVAAPLPIVVPLPTPPTATVSAPVTKTATPTTQTQVKASIGMNGSSSVNVAVTVPIGAVSNNVTVSIAPAVTPAEAAAGLVSIKVTITDATGAAVTQFNTPLTLNLGAAAAGTTPAFSQDNLVWTVIQKLAGTTLPDGVQQGYYQATDGSIVILTRHLTYFGEKRTQGVLLASVSGANVAVGGRLTMASFGGTGTGATSFRSNTATTCSVTPLGIVTALSAGTCTLVATKTGDGTYLDATSSPLDVMVTAAAAVPRVTRVGGIMVVGAGVLKSVRIDLGAIYGGKRVGIQVRKAGSAKYATLGQLTLNRAGMARSSLALPRRATVRVTLNGRSLATTVVK